MIAKFKPGDRVEVMHTGRTWHKAVIVSIAPYYKINVMGYYVSYPEATELWHCHGGWISENCVRVPTSEWARL